MHRIGMGPHPLIGQRDECQSKTRKIVMGLGSSVLLSRLNG